MRLRSRLPFALAAAAVVIAIPLVGALGSTGPAGDLGLGRFLAQGSAFAFVLAFAGGVLTSLTPCVYPLIPITVSVFGARQARTRGQAAGLSGLYVLGIAVTYSALGVGAALTGRAFGGAMQSPWVLGSVALLFAAMALSMFGLFELELPTSLQARLARAGGAGPAGALVMGLVAGLIAAPCTGPVLAAALTYVATRGSVAFGVGIMFAYALGMGLLFFLIGAFSIALPKSGRWLETVKAVFGVALLALAVLYLKDAFPSLRVAITRSGPVALIAAPLAALGVLFGALQGGFSGPRLERALKTIGIALVVGSLVTAAAARQAPAGGAAIAWLHDEPQALALARSEGRPVIVDFWADWCTACNELDHTAWSDPEVQAAASRFVTLKVDGSTESPAFLAAMEKYQVVGMPTVILLDSRGRELPERITSVLEAKEVLRRLEAIE